ncbi:MAG: L,D-transpeptidase family protein [Planctomycetota bacterium]
MNSLKTLVMVVVLAAVGYVVYISIMKNPRQTSDLPDAAPWAGTGPMTAEGPVGPPPVDMPGSPNLGGLTSAPDFASPLGAPTSSIGPNGQPNAVPGGMQSGQFTPGNPFVNPAAPASGDWAAVPPGDAGNPVPRVLPSPRSAPPAASAPAAENYAGSGQPPNGPAGPTTSGTTSTFPAEAAVPASPYGGRYADFTPPNNAPSTLNGTPPTGPATDAQGADPTSLGSLSHTLPNPMEKGTLDPRYGSARLGQTPGEPGSLDEGGVNPVAAMTPDTMPPEALAQFQSVLQAVHTKLNAGQLDEGLLALTQVYDMPGLPDAQRRSIEQLLGQVAGSVIYSQQHLLEPPYQVRAGETLEQIAQYYAVPADLLAKINGLSSASALQPGQPLKVMRGPFEAKVHLGRRELVLYLNGRYAGKFSIGVGRDQPNLEGSYLVRNKVLDPKYYGPDGFTVDVPGPANPLGRYCVELGSGIGIHGTNNPQAIGRDDNRGTICLNDRDAEDVFSILSVGSRVTIAR